MVQLYFLNLVMNPKHYIDYEALEKSREELKAASVFHSQHKKKLFEKDPYRKKSVRITSGFSKIMRCSLSFIQRKTDFINIFKIL